jgi:Lrp/AsnC family transcriptional regulator, leucine-responsive regulatory protein
MRGDSAGTGRRSSAATVANRSIAPLSQGSVNRSGCHASPSRTARRSPASLLPPIQTGIREAGEPQRLRDNRTGPRLEERGVITGYRADVDLAVAGYPVLAVVRLKYPGSRHQPLHRLLGECLEILECLRVTGDDCYTLKVAATSMPHLEQLVNELAAFGSTTTSVVYSHTLSYRGPRAPATTPPVG